MDIKTIVFCEDITKFDTSLNIISKNFNKFYVVKNKTNLNTEITDENDKIFVIFIDEDFIEKLDPDLESLLCQENFICILLKKYESNSIFRDYRIIEDVFFYNLKNIIPIFIKRLNHLINYKVELKNAHISLGKFCEISLYLLKEKNIDILIDSLLKYSMELTKADSSAIYFVTSKDRDKFSFYNAKNDKKMLKFIMAKNNMININLKPKLYPMIKESIAGSTVIGGKTINITDAYNLPEGSDYVFDKNFDITFDYYTKSILSIPIKDIEGNILGVIQLMNKKNDGKTLSFNSEDEAIVCSLVGHTSAIINSNIVY